MSKFDSDEDGDVLGRRNFRPIQPNPNFILNVFASRMPIMTPSLRLIFAVHNHQPVGNFDGVFSQACDDAYDPFMDVVEEFPKLPITMHISGSLLEWLESNRPDYVERIRDCVQKGRMEILGGPFYEPILAAIPKRDRIGQIKAYRDHLERVFSTDVRGMWVPERVWEPNFVGDIIDAGMEYTILDDSHFRWAGLAEDKLHGYYITEDEGRLLKVFPDDETLRYTIPWSSIDEVMDYLRGLAERAPGTICSFGDDGEKFGSWPGTFEHVYGSGWLRDFFQAVQDNSDWLEMVTMAEAVSAVSPRGKVYLPNASYREMTEWALPTDQQIDYKRVVENNKERDDWEETKPFVRAGFWRNFLVKYPEANEMYCRSREVSDRLERLRGSVAAQQNPHLFENAQQDLYRGQCNCPYWHGAFGGLYLPHLRNGIYRHLIAADNAISKLEGKTDRWVSIDINDYNLDARQEVRMASDRLVGYLAPARGGHLYELDIRSTGVNLLSTLNRRPEPYHQTVIDAAGLSSDVDDVEFNKHEGVRFKQEDLDKKIAYDRWPRKSLVDHFLRPGVTPDEFREGNGNVGDFVLGVHEAKVRESASRIETVMSRQGKVGEHWVTMVKTVALDTSRSGQLEVSYELSGLPVGEEIHFAVELNFAGMAAGADDRYFYDGTGRQCGQLETIQAVEQSSRFGLVDEWLGVDASVESTQPADFWTFPIQTVSQSEGGFELVHQSSVVVPNWKFIVDESKTWNVELSMSVDTSIAQARLLAEVTHRN